jgi:hypothetical protein
LWIVLSKASNVRFLESAAINTLTFIQYEKGTQWLSDEKKTVTINQKLVKLILNYVGKWEQLDINSKLRQSIRLNFEFGREGH